VGPGVPSGALLVQNAVCWLDVEAHLHLPLLASPV
jgi:hypothetical protein